MSLEAGTKLGPREIVSALGAGGMGEIYGADSSTSRLAQVGPVSAKRAAREAMRKKRPLLLRVVHSL